MLLRETIVCKARLAKRARRYEDMVHYVNDLVGLGPQPLNLTERCLFASAYRNLYKEKRTAWWRICSKGQSNNIQEDKTVESQAHLEYKSILESEMAHISEELKELLQGLMKENIDSASKAYYFKIDADHSRYRAEWDKGTEKEEAVEAARAGYLRAQKAAQMLRPTDPTRLSVALSFSAFLSEVANDKAAAYDIADDAVSLAIYELDLMKKGLEKSMSRKLLDLLEANIVVWSASLTD